MFRCILELCGITQVNRGMNGDTFDMLTMYFEYIVR